MTQEIKLKLKQAAETAWEQDQKTNPSPVNPHAYVYGYKAGAQTILDNPVEWDLVKYEDHKKYYDALGVQNNELKFFINSLQSQLTEYRQALERIIVESEDNEQVDWMYVAENMVEIAKETLKQKTGG